jgi:hypothetical protein
MNVQRMLDPTGTASKTMRARAGRAEWAIASGERTRALRG